MRQFTSFDDRRWMWWCALAALACGCGHGGGAPDVPIGANAALTAPFSGTFVGDPAAPLPFEGNETWDITNLTQSDSNNPDLLLYPMDAQHSPSCGPYDSTSRNTEGQPGTHHITRHVEAAFICRNHLMTAVNGFGEIGIT